MKQMTAVEEKVLAYIYGYASDWEIVPSESQIAEEFGFTRQNASYYVKLLIGKKKLIKINPQLARGYALLTDAKKGSKLRK